MTEITDEQLVEWERRSHDGCSGDKIDCILLATTRAVQIQELIAEVRRLRESVASWRNGAMKVLDELEPMSNDVAGRTLDASPPIRIRRLVREIHRLRAENSGLRAEVEMLNNQTKGETHDPHGTLANMYDELRAENERNAKLALDNGRALCVARTEIKRLRSVMEQTHVNHCSAAWTDRGLHAPECLQYELEPQKPTAPPEPFYCEICGSTDPLDGKAHDLSGVCHGKPTVSPGSTHWGDCWKERGHHACAISMVKQYELMLDDPPFLREHSGDTPPGKREDS